MDQLNSNDEQIQEADEQLTPEEAFATEMKRRRELHENGEESLIGKAEGDDDPEIDDDENDDDEHGDEHDEAAPRQPSRESQADDDDEGDDPDPQASYESMINSLPEGAKETFDQLQAQAQDYHQKFTSLYGRLAPIQRENQDLKNQLQEMKAARTNPPTPKDLIVWYAPPPPPPVATAGPMPPSYCWFGRRLLPESGAIGLSPPTIVPLVVILPFAMSIRPGFAGITLSAASSLFDAGLPGFGRLIGVMCCPGGFLPDGRAPVAETAILGSYRCILSLQLAFAQVRIFQHLYRVPIVGLGFDLQRKILAARFVSKLRKNGLFSGLVRVTHECNCIITV